MSGQAWKRRKRRKRRQRGQRGQRGQRERRQLFAVLPRRLLAHDWHLRRPKRAKSLHHPYCPCPYPSSSPRPRPRCPGCVGLHLRTRLTCVEVSAAGRPHSRLESSHWTAASPACSSPERRPDSPAWLHCTAVTAPPPPCSSSPSANLLLGRASPQISDVPHAVPHGYGGHFAAQRVRSDALSRKSAAEGGGPAAGSEPTARARAFAAAARATLVSSCYLRGGSVLQMHAWRSL